MVVSKKVLSLHSRTKTIIMKVTKLREGVYKVTDSKGTWIAKGGYSTLNNKWGGWDATSEDEVSNETNWGVTFNTFKELKKYSQSF